MFYQSPPEAGFETEGGIEDVQTLPEKFMICAWSVNVKVTIEHQDTTTVSVGFLEILLHVDWSADLILLLLLKLLVS